MSYTTYKHDGVKVPRVTTICGLLDKPGLVYWANKQGLKGINTQNVLIETAAIGTSVHEAVQWHMMHGNDHKLNEELEGKSNKDQADILYAYNKYLALDEITHISDPTCEITLTCPRFGGRLDVLSQFKGDRALIDIKTSNQIYDSHIIQLAAYKRLLEFNDLEANKFYILSLPVRSEEPPQLKEISIEEISLYGKIFDHLLNIYEIQKELKKFLKDKSDE